MAKAYTLVISSSTTCFLKAFLSFSSFYSYKWVATDCFQARPFYCMAKAPSCPKGYTWLPQLGRSCVKLTGVSGIKYGNATLFEQPRARQACAREGTRLAHPTTQADLAVISGWFDDLRVSKLEK